MTPSPSTSKILPLFQDSLASEWKIQDDKLEEKVGIIFQTIGNCSLKPEEHAALIQKISELSPKRTGTYLETFNRELHGFFSAKHSSHDALSTDGRKIEIKASRVLFSENGDEHSNLLDQLMQETRLFLPFSRCLEAQYDCNIQQVKPKEFDEIHYSLFFKDVILNFKMKKADFESQAIENTLEELRENISENGVLKLSVKHQLIEHLNSPDWTSNRRLKEAYGTFQAMLDEHKASHLLDESSLKEQLYRRIKLGYSDKQHRGNQGEGQFHITKENLGYHLMFNFNGAYHYHDFIQVLKNTILKKGKAQQQASSSNKGGMKR